MALIAKRKLDQTWREAVLERADAADRREQAVAALESHSASGLDEAEASFRALGQLDLLWRVDLPGEVEPMASAPADAPVD